LSVRDIQIAGINGLRTIFNFDHKDKRYKEFLKVRRLCKEEYSGKVVELSNNLFGNLFKEYLHDLRLSGYSVDSHWNNSMKVTFQGKKIIPGREEILDGYIPIVMFTPSQRSLSAESYLKKEGTWKLNVIDDILRLVPNGNNNKNSRIKLENSNEGEKISIAPVEYLSNLLGNIEKLYESVGKKI